jgi:GxxExxY protein
MQLCVHSVKLCVRLIALPGFTHCKRALRSYRAATPKARMNTPNSDGLTKQIIGLAMRVHTHLGPGLLESAYERCLCHEFDRNALAYRRQVDLPLDYDGVHLDCGYRADMIVNDEVILELKSVEHILPLHEAQLLTYLRLSRCHVGLLLNFNTLSLKDGIRRRIL